MITLTEPGGALVRPRFRVASTAAALVVLAFGLVWIQVLTEISAPIPPADWLAFVIAAAGLVICERTPAAGRERPLGCKRPTIFEDEYCKWNFMKF